jgi:ferredoxin-NADP reductase
LNERINFKSDLNYQFQVAIDGPYGAPSSHIFRAEHAVLIAAGIGVTPFASILQSIMHRYYAIRQSCPNCNHSWASQMPDSIMNLKKVISLFSNPHYYADKYLILSPFANCFLLGRFFLD